MHFIYVLACLLITLSLSHAYIYRFGLEEEGGVESVTGTTTPTLAEFGLSLRSRKIKQIAAGEYHVLVLTTDGKLFASGNNDNGQIGDGNFQSVSNFTEVDVAKLVSSKASIVQISAGSKFSVFLTNQGKMYTWGDNERGQLADNNFVMKSRPTPIFNAKKLNFTSVCAGNDFILALSHDGKLYGAGNREYSQFGTTKSSDIDDITKPTLINMGALGNGTDPVTSIACGYSHSMVLTRSGNLYIAGALFADEDSPVDEYIFDDYTLVNVSAIRTGDKIKEIRAGKYSAFIITEKGRLLSFGTAADYRLGHDFAGGNNFVIQPTEAKFVQNFPQPVVDVEPGFTHTIVLFENGTFGTFGSNFYGELGIGSTAAALPRLYIPIFHHRVRMIATGSSTSFVVTCPPGSMDDGTSGCMICPAGTYSRASSGECAKCPAGTYSTQGSGFCNPCAYGTYTAKSGSTSCLPCNPESNCPIGAVAANVVVPYANSLSNQDPYLHYKKEQANDPKFLYIRIGIVAFFVLLGLVVLIGLLVFTGILWHRHRSIGYRVQEGLRKIDSYPMNHAVEEGASPINFGRPIGGLFTIILVCSILTILAVSILEAVSSNEFIKSYLAPESNLVGNGYNTEVKKDFSVQLTLHGFPSKCNLTSTAASGFSKYNWTTVGDEGNHTCTVKFSCPSCVLSQQEQSITMSFDDDFAMASHISYEIKTGFYMGEFITKGVAVPNDKSSVYRGPVANVLPVTITKVQHFPLLPDYYIYGIFSKLQHHSRHTEFSYSTSTLSFGGQSVQRVQSTQAYGDQPPGLSVALLFTVNPNVQVYEEESKSLFFDLVTKIAALSGTINGILIFLLTFIEGCKMNKKRQNADHVRYDDVLFLDPHTRTKARTLLLNEQPKDQELKEVPKSESGLVKM